MKIIRRIACMVCMVLFTASCSYEAKEEAFTDENRADTDIAVTVSVSPNNEECITTAEISETASASSIETEHYVIAETETVEKSDALNSDCVQIDLNCDGIAEDFFIGNDVYEIKLYTDRSPDGYHSFTLPRVESIDIYRRAYDDSTGDDSTGDDSTDEFAYSFSCVFGNDKYIAFHLVYTGCKSDKCISGMGYGQNLAPFISYREWFSTMLQEEFEELIRDPHCYFKPEWEYVQTLNLEEIANSGCVQSYVQNIRINDDIDEIQMFSLENDVFNKEIKLTNEKYSVYVSDFDYMEIYERTAVMEIPTDEYHVYDHTPRNEKDYLLCLRSTDSESTECVYLGTADEGYLFLYNFNYNNDNGFSVENADSLKKDGWQYVRSLDIDA